MHQTPMVLQMVIRSAVKLEGISEDIIVTIDSWECPIDFIILHPKTNMGGYPLILVWPWLETMDAYIECCSGNMTISQGETVKNITLYPLAKSILDIE